MPRGTNLILRPGDGPLLRWGLCSIKSSWTLFICYFFGGPRRAARHAPTVPGTVEWIIFSFWDMPRRVACPLYSTRVLTVISCHCQASCWQCTHVAKITGNFCPRRTSTRYCTPFEFKLYLQFCLPSREVQPHVSVRAVTRACWMLY